MNAEPGIPPLRRRSNEAGPAAFTLDPELLAANRIFGFGQMSEQLYPFFMIRSALLAHVEASGHRVLAITSVEAGNGKTHVAANLAAVLSRVRPTVLVELDLRRPSLGTRLGLVNDMGIVNGTGIMKDRAGIDDYLTGEAAWLDTAMVIDGFDLTIHRARRPHPCAEQLLASPRLSHALRHIAAEDEATICLIDTPPALIGDDLLHIARAADGVLLVAQEGRSRKNGVLEVSNALGATPIVGTILNMALSAPARLGSYGYYRNPTGEER